MEGNIWLVGLIVLLMCSMFFMQARSAKKNKKVQEEMRSQVVIGAEVMTVGGIIGRIVAMDNSKNTITIESGTSQIVLTARAIHSVVTPVAPVSIPEVKAEETEVAEKTEE
ncbi:MAG: preprotein translocase subunit YajC [Clostridia bacterium]|nr:preprotein translocase subunit YajC [Clostridia bacterium]